MTVVIGVGTNLGAREALIRGAEALLEARTGIAVHSVSKIYETKPLGPPQPMYLNAAFRLKTDLSPSAVLAVLLRTERRLGRHRDPDERWGPRSIDLDLLWDARGALASPGLTVPHAELENRPFAIAPLLDVAPELAGRLGGALQALGGPPPEWNRQAIIRCQSFARGSRVEVEADSLADACALAIGRAEGNGRSWSTCHLEIAADGQAFAAALRDTLHKGFRVQRATISHCSQSRWAVEFHGVNTGVPLAGDVRLQTTSGAEREECARLELRVIGA